MSTIKLTFEIPKNGWLTTSLKSSDFELSFITSDIPENPIDLLCESLTLALNGIESEICWNLEPDCYFFQLKPSEKEIDFIVSKSGGIIKSRNLIYELNGSFESVILPMYRSLKKFNTLEFDTADWKKLDKIKLNKLTELVTERKNYLQQNL